MAQLEENGDQAMIGPVGPRGRQPAERRRLLPARASVIAALFVSKSLAALVVGVPLSLSVAHVVGRYPRLDATLWDAGGVLLLETERQLRPAFDAIAWQSGTLAVLAMFALLLPLGVLIASLPPAGLAPGSQRPRSLLRRAAAHFGTLALMQGTALIAQVALSVLIVMLGASLALAFGLAPRGTDLAQLASAAVALAAVAWFAVVHDIARVAAVQHRLGMFDAVASALTMFRASARRVTIEAAGRGALAAVLLLAAGWAGARLGCATSARWAATTLLQHAAVLGVVLLRASWLRWVSLRLSVPAVRAGWNAQSAELESPWSG